MIIMNAMDEHIKSCFQNFGEFSAIFLNNMNQSTVPHHPPDSCISHVLASRQRV